MRKKINKRYLSLFLSGALAVSLCPPQSVFGGSADKTEAASGQIERSLKTASPSVPDREEEEEPNVPETPDETEKPTENEKPDENKKPDKNEQPEGSEDDNQAEDDEKADGDTANTPDNTETPGTNSGANGTVLPDSTLLPEETVNPEENVSEEAVKNVQKLIDALPAADEITAETLEDVSAQLSEIEDAMNELNDDERAKLKLARYHAAVSAVEKLNEAKLMQAAEEITVSFYSDSSVGGTLLSKQTVKKGGKLTEPQDPAERDGYTFLGWSRDRGATIWNFNDPVETDMRLSAVWKLNIEAPKQYSTHRKKIGTVAWSPVKGASGYLLQLYSGDDPTTAEPIGNPVRVNSDTTAYTFRIEGVSHPYIFSFRSINQDGKTGPEVFSDPITYLPDPEKLLWSTISSGLARWNKVAGATGYVLQLYGGETVEERYAIGDPIEVNASTTTYRFDIDSTLHSYMFSVIATGTSGPSHEIITGPRKFSSVNVSKVTVGFNPNGGYPEKLASIIMPLNMSISSLKGFEPPTPYKQGYKLKGWCLDPTKLDELWNFNTKITTSMTLTAVWEPETPNKNIKIQVYFDSNGGMPTSIPSQTTTRGGLIKEPTAPTRSGYKFAGWIPKGAGPGTPFWNFEKDGVYPENENDRTFTLWAIWYTQEHQAGVDSVNIRYAEDTSAPGSGLASGKFSSSNVIDVELPSGSKIPTDPSKVQIVTTSGAKISNLQTKDNGKTWTFTVTSDDGKLTENYTIRVSVSLPAPASAEWDKFTVGKGTWKTVKGANGYILQLYRDGGPGGRSPLGEPITIKDGNASSYIFQIDNTDQGYSFGVRAYRSDSGNETSSPEVYSSPKPFDQVNVSEVTVTFIDTTEGHTSTLATSRVSVGKRVQAPTGVTKEGYRLIGWRLNPSKMWDFNDPVTTSMLLTAVWTKADASNNTSLSSVYVNDTRATISNSMIRVTLPSGSEITDDPSDIRITPADSNATVSNLKTTNGGRSWTFTVTAENGTSTKNYRLYVSVRSSGSGGGGGGSSSGGGGGSSSGGGGGAVSSGGSYVAGGPGASGSGPANTANGTWKQDSTGWWVEKPDGSYPQDAWYEMTWKDNKNWYHFNPTGYLDSGWFTDKDGNTYFLHNTHDDRFGYMYTGWNWIGGKCYYFNPVSGQNGLPYGAMLKNTTTPDGYTVNEAGEWTVNGAVQVQEQQPAASAQQTDTSAAQTQTETAAQTPTGDFEGFKNFVLSATSAKKITASVVRDAAGNTTVSISYKSNRSSNLPKDGAEVVKWAKRNNVSEFKDAVDAWDELTDSVGKLAQLYYSAYRENFGLNGNLTLNHLSSDDNTVLLTYQNGVQTFNYVN